LRPLAALVALGSGIVALTVATLALLPWRPDTPFVAQALLGGLLAMVATRVAQRCPEREGLLVILVVALLLRTILLAMPPFLSSDIYRYVWDGRVQAAGINPYRHVPAAPELQALRDLAIFPNVNRADFAVTIYPPAAQGLFLLATRVAESVLAMKVAFVAFEALTVAALVALLRRLGRPATRVVAYAWHPLVLWEVAGNGHVDAAMTALVMLALWLHASGRALAAGAAAAVGALFKPFALLVLPTFWRPWDWKLPLVVFGVVALLYAPYLSVGAGCSASCPATSGRNGSTRARASGCWRSLGRPSALRACPRPRISRDPSPCSRRSRSGPGSGGSGRSRPPSPTSTRCCSSSCSCCRPTTRGTVSRWSRSRRSQVRGRPGR
jgi:hypothetical protein